MFGFILALLYAAWVVIFGDSAPEVAYLKATGFLYGWYVFWTWVLGAFVALIALLVMLGGVAAGASKGRGIGAVVGMVLGGGLSGLIVFLFAVRRALYVGGGVPPRARAHARVAVALEPGVPDPREPAPPRRVRHWREGTGLALARRLNAAATDYVIKRPAPLEELGESFSADALDFPDRT